MREELARRIELERIFHKSEEKLQSLLHATSESLFLLDLDGTVQLANRTAAEQLGSSQEELIGERFFDLFPDSVAEKRRDVFRRVVATRRIHSLEDEREGRTYRAHYHPVFDATGHVAQVAVFARDVSQRNEAERQLQRLAYYDPLTDLPNRQYFCLLLARTMAATPRGIHRLGLILVDIDRLKAVNDTLGHSAGDRLIQEIGERMRIALPADGTLARVGGDEFMILVRHPEREDGIETVGSRVRSSVRQLFRLEGVPFRPEVSVGCSVYPDLAGTKERLVQQADISLEHSKRCVMNKVQVYDHSFDDVSLRYSLELELGRALEEDQFELHYQPLVDLQRGATVGLEALLRWNHPTWGCVPPEQFIETLEQTGYIRDVGEWTLARVCDVVRQSGIERSNLRVTVNVSANQLYCPELLASVRRIMLEKSVPHGSLGIEVTENSAMQDIESAGRTLRELSRMGIWTILDDFGKGYSSLNILRRLPVDIVKIDRSFVANLPEKREDSAMVGSIVSLVSMMGKSVVAEGIERQNQASYLAGLGCEMGQGYLFGYPEPFDQAIRQIGPTLSLNI